MRLRVAGPHTLGVRGQPWRVRIADAEASLCWVRFTSTRAVSFAQIPVILRSVFCGYGKRLGEQVIDSCFPGAPEALSTLYGGQGVAFFYGMAKPVRAPQIGPARRID
jgi:hypothetical protein